MLPKVNGFEILKKIREKNIDAKVIMLTAKSMIEDKLEGFNKGANDYITKPFHIDELVARVNAQLRVNTLKAPKDYVKAGDLKLNTKTTMITCLTTNEGHWGFPKGHVEENETEIETATREVKEETNLDVEVDSNKRYATEYVTNVGKLKQVVFFIAKCIGGEIKAQECEVSEIRWVEFDEAIKLITYDNTRALFEKVIDEERLV